MMSADDELAEGTGEEDTVAASSPNDDDYGPPFEARSFGGEFVWAEAPGYTAKILRVRPKELVIVSTRGRTDMVVMLTGGRAVLEIRDGSEVDRVELLPAAPLRLAAGPDYRLIAVTDVELLTIYSPLRPPSPSSA